MPFKGSLEKEKISRADTISAFLKHEKND